MKTKVALILFTSLLIIACNATNTNQRLSVEVNQAIAATATPPSLQSIQIGHPETLPPYGILVQADQAVLTIRIDASNDTVSNTLTLMQQTVTQIAELADTHETIEFHATKINQLNSQSNRSIESSLRAENFHTSAMHLKLAAPLNSTPDALLESLVTFETFLNSLTPPDDITIEALSVETEISDIDSYRTQIINNLYQELVTVQETYGQDIDFEVTNLYGRLQILPITDTSYYLYLEPTIGKHDF